MNGTGTGHKDAFPTLELQVHHTTNHLMHTRHESEVCPSYSCTTTISCNLLTKYELEAPSVPSSNRKWFPAHIEVIGTMLNISVSPSKRHLRSLRSLTIRSQSDCVTRNYTLQGAEVGIASDYKKRRFVIRVRAEAEQFLLEVESLSVLLNVIRVLETAIDLSLPLESRKMPRVSGYPRRAPTAIQPQDQRTMATLLGKWIRARVRPSCFNPRRTAREAITRSTSNVCQINGSTRFWPSQR